MSHQDHSDLRVLRRLFAQARPFWPYIGLVTILQLVAIPLALLNPLPLKIAVDSVVGSHPLPDFLAPAVPDLFGASAMGLLVFAALLQIGIVLLTQAQVLANNTLRTWTGESLTLNFRARLFRHVQRLSLLFHDAKGTTDSTYRIQYDAPAIQWVMIYGVVSLLASAAMLVGMIYVVARINGQMALVALVITPVLYLVAHSYGRRMRAPYRRSKELDSGALKVIQEVLTALRVVKAFGREEDEQERFVSRSGESMRSRIRLAFAEGLLGVAVNVTVAIGTAAVLLVGVRNVLAGTMSLGDLLVVFAYLSQLYGPLQTISGKVSGFRNNLTSAQRAFEILDEVPEVEERSNARGLAEATGAIEFRGVRFGYSPSSPVLRDLSFQVPAGSRVGISGSTGAGKTTLISLLVRFYDPQDGRILMDGCDIRDIKLADLRNQFAIVLQEPVLFSTTIGENIAYGRPGASPDEIEAAARAANAHRFITALPQGYDTGVGERGMQLSGGERQRVSLARAFLKDAPILILDEPTSSVDVDTESEILQAMERLMRDRTTFMITHRTGTLAGFDLQIVLEGGRARVIADHFPGGVAKRAAAPPSSLDEAVGGVNYPTHPRAVEPAT